MGQGLGAGAIAGTMAPILLLGADLGKPTYLALSAGCTALGLSVDLASDVFARHGQVTIDRDVILNATDIVRHVYTYYAYSHAHPVSKFIRQKHEWLILESHTHKFYTVQKCPATGDLSLTVRSTLRTANDVGLRAAMRPTLSGEIRQQRMDQEFDLPNDLQVAYIIAWLRKEDPRWTVTTENSKHFCTKLRYALNDF